MLVIQACCSATVCLIHEALAHFEKVCSPVVVRYEKFLFYGAFMEL